MLKIFLYGVLVILLISALVLGCVMWQEDAELALRISAHPPPDLHVAPPTHFTTTDGKTYDNVVVLGTNTEELYIQFRDGASASSTVKKEYVRFAVLPKDIQVMYRYDADREKAMDAYLVCLYPDSPLEQVRAYAGQVKNLASHPSRLRSLTPGLILWLGKNRLIGAFVAYKLPAEEAANLRTDETKLTGEMLMQLERGVNPSIDTRKPFWIRDTSKAAMDERQQIEVKRTIWRFVKICGRHLRYFYSYPQYEGTKDVASLDAEVRPVMLEADIDSNSIDLLIGKTQPSDH